MYPNVSLAVCKPAFLKAIVKMLKEYSGCKQSGKNYYAGILNWFHLFQTQIFFPHYECRQEHCKPTHYLFLPRGYDFRSKFQLDLLHRDDDVEQPHGLSCQLEPAKGRNLKAMWLVISCSKYRENSVID